MLSLNLNKLVFGRHVCSKDVDEMTNCVDPYQTAPGESDSDLDLQCLLRPECPKTKDRYDCIFQQVQENSPGHAAGLEAFFDFIVAIGTTRLVSFHSPIMRKPVYAICEQQRRRSACASAQSDQHLCCSLLG